MDAGQWIGGYRLVERLGTGGSGTVWRAVDDGGTVVALKLVHPAVAESEESRQRLIRETHTVNSVKISGVAHVLDVETEALQPFIVSEYVPGETLEQCLSGGALSPDEAIDIASQLWQTISAVHDAGVIHRDIKPGNVILSQRGPVLIDFGIARGDGDERLTAHGFVSGTASYASPELLRGAQAGVDSDAWAWSVTFVQMLTGRPPFGVGTTEAIMRRVLNGQPDVEGLPLEVAQVCLRLLHADVSLRMSPDEALMLVADSALWGSPTEVMRVDVAPTSVLPVSGASSAPIFLPEGGGVDHTRVMLPQVLPDQKPASVDWRGDEWAFEERVASGYFSPPAQLPSWEDSWEGESASMSLAAPASVPGVGVVLCALGAFLPLFFGYQGVVLLLSLLVVLAFVGNVRRFVRRRRLLAGGVRSSDWWVGIARSPMSALLSVFQIFVGMVCGILFAVTGVVFAYHFGAHWLFEGVNEPFSALLREFWMTHEYPAIRVVTSRLIPALVCFVAVWFALLVLWFLPSGRGIREGVAWPVRAILPLWWMRLIGVVAGAGAVLLIWAQAVNTLVFAF